MHKQQMFSWFKVYALCTLYFVLFFIFSALHPPLAGAGAVRGVSPAAGGQLQPQLPDLLPGGGRRRGRTGQGGQLPIILDYDNNRHHCHHRHRHQALAFF